MKCAFLLSPAGRHSPPAKEGYKALAMERLKECRRRVVGTKETLKAVEKGEAQVVYVARDAEVKVTQPVLSLCRERGVEVRFVDSMRELGKWCGIKIGAAAAAIIEL